MKHLLLTAAVLSLFAASASAQTPEPTLVPGGATEKAIAAELAKENAKNRAALKFNPRDFELQPKQDQPVTILRGR